jgi:enoyl-[acyl-carrier-protein] reductase (NADH)
MLTRQILAIVAPTIARSMRRWIFHLGGLGFIPLGLLDGSVIPLPGSMDVLTIVLSARQRELWSYYLAKELGPRGITANVVAPGAIQTDFAGGIVRDNPEINKRVAETTALGRAGVPDDIGPMIAALLSDDNRWVNGQRIEVSGGMYL